MNKSDLPKAKSLTLPEHDSYIRYSVYIGIL